MPPLSAPPLGLPARAFTGGPGGQAPSGIAGELMVSELVARYGSLVKTGRVQTAYATLAAASPVAFNVTNGVLMGGPVVWNKAGSNLDAHILGIGIAVSTANTTGPTTIGLTGNTGQVVVPTSTTAIDAQGNAYIGGPATQMTVYRTMTPTAGQTPPFFLPLFTVGTTALGAQFTPTYIDVAGAVICGPTSWVSVATNLVPTAFVASIAMIWAELPA